MCVDNEKKFSSSKEVIISVNDEQSNVMPNCSLQLSKLACPNATIQLCRDLDIDMKNNEVMMKLGALNSVPLTKGSTLINSSDNANRWI